MRLIVSLPDEQIQFLEEQSKKTFLSKSVLVQLALNNLMGTDNPFIKSTKTLFTDAESEKA